MAIVLVPAPASSSEFTQDQVTTAVEKHLGIYSTNSDWRDVDERIEVQGDSLLIWYRSKSKGGLDARDVCEVGRWLMLGRLEGTQGVFPLFKALDGLRVVALIVYDVATSVQLKNDGRYQQKRRIEPRIRILIEAAKLKPKSRDEISTQLKGPKCLDALRAYATDVVLLPQE